MTRVLVFTGEEYLNSIDCGYIEIEENINGYDVIIYDNNNKLINIINYIGDDINFRIFKIDNFNEGVIDI